MFNSDFKQKIDAARNSKGKLKWAGNVELAFLVVCELRKSSLDIKDFSSFYKIDRAVLGNLNNGLTVRGTYWVQLNEKIKSLPPYDRKKKYENVDLPDLKGLTFETELAKARDELGKVKWKNNLTLAILTVIAFRTSGMTIPAFVNTHKIAMSTLQHLNAGKTSCGIPWVALQHLIDKLKSQEWEM